MGNTTEQLATMADTVSKLDLGHGWEYVPDNNPDNHRALGHWANPDIQGHIGFNSVWNEAGKIHIYGAYPRDSKGLPHDTGVSSGSINVSMFKGPAAISKDIIRRFMPEYLANLGKVRATIQQYETRWDTLSAMGKDLADGLPQLKLYDSARGDTEEVRRVRNSDKVTLESKADKGPSINAEVHSDGEVSVSIAGLTMDQAKRILGIAALYLTCKHGHYIQVAEQVPPNCKECQESARRGREIHEEIMSMICTCTHARRQHKQVYGDRSCQVPNCSCEAFEADPDKNKED